MLNKPLMLFNSLGRELEVFQSLHAGCVRMYSCGPTVYNYAHLGNLRAYLFTDTLRRTLMLKGYDVQHVMNITDVGHLTSDADEGQDKMESAASAQQRSVWDIAAYYSDHFKTDLARLNILSPSSWPRATDHIQEMIAFAERLEQRGYTYCLSDGLYFDSSKVENYGKLGLLDIEGLQAGARVAVTEGKRQNTDFALWRCSPSDTQRLMEWHSPWGVGAPGWHLECSVMSLKYLGAHFDIHTGGIDHRQVHHCNEIAQNQAYLDATHAGVNYWLHNEFLQVDDTKMSKSSGDFLRLQTLIDEGIHPLVYRYFVLTASYRSILEFSWDAVVGARTGLLRLLKRVARLKDQASALSEWQWVLEESKASCGGSLAYPTRVLSEGLSAAAQIWLTRFDEALSNDLNTPQVLAHLADLIGSDTVSADDMLRIIAIYDQVLGLQLLQLEPGDILLRPKQAVITEAAIEQQIDARNKARAQKDYAGADRIRDALLAEGVLLQDSSEGTSWEWRPNGGV